ncbi:MAG: biotin/lipoyl-containing protein, partial [Lysobacterales bacterium]
MADLKEARVPDIGHADVPVIEVLVKVGDRVEKEQSLITLESDKATMEVPAPFAGTVKELKLKVGDEVSEGAVIAMIETDGEAVSASPSPAPGEGRGEGAQAPTKSPSPQSSPQRGEEANAKSHVLMEEKPAPIAGQGVQPGNAPEGDAPPTARPPLDATIVNTSGGM